MIINDQLVLDMLSSPSSAAPKKLRQEEPLLRANAQPVVVATLRNLAEKKPLSFSESELNQANSSKEMPKKPRLSCAIPRMPAPRRAAVISPSYQAPSTLTLYVANFFSAVMLDKAQAIEGNLDEKIRQAMKMSSVI